MLITASGWYANEAKTQKYLCKLPNQVRTIYFTNRKRPVHFGGGNGFGFLVRLVGGI